MRWVPAEPGAKVVGLRWGHSPEKYEYEEFGSPQEAWAYAGGRPFVEVVTLRNHGGEEFTFEGRFLPDPSGVLRLGAAVERVWYTVLGSDTVYQDFHAAREDADEGPGRRSFVIEHLRLREPDGRAVEQDGRLLNLDPTRRTFSLRFADAYRQEDGRGR